MMNEKIRISVSDLPARPSRPSDEEMEQIFGGWGWRSFRRVVRRVGRGAIRLGHRGWRAGRRVVRRVGRTATRVGRGVSRVFRRIFRGW